MSVKQKFTTVGGTIACALGIGYFMQQGEMPAGQTAVASPQPVKQAQLDPVKSTDDVVLDLEEIVLTAAPTEEEPVITEFKVAGVLPMEFAVTQPEPAPKIVDCSIVARASVVKTANVDLTVSAPCFKNERLTVHHNGLMFTETTNADGDLQVEIPAFSNRAVFIVEFQNGKGAVAVADVPLFAKVNRVAVQWAGNGGFQVHAREFGADYGEEGHVWSGSAHLEGAETDPYSGGYVTRLGDAETLAPKLVEIYSFPVGQTEQQGSVRLSVETEVTPANCGRKITAQSLELRGGESPRTRDLVLTMPDCAAVGDLLVLNNLVDDLIIASN